MKPDTPPGWPAGQIEHRFTSSHPSSYDEVAHSVECVISLGSEVRRFHGRERLRIPRA